MSREASAAPRARKPPFAPLALPLALALLAGCTDPATPSPGPPPPSTGPFTDVTAAFGLDAPQASFRSGVGDDCDLAKFMTGAAAVGDVDGDGWPDIYLPRLGLPDRLMINLEGAGFEDRAPAAGLALEDDGGGATLFDRDADGDLDLWRTSPTGGPMLFDNDGAGRFTEVPGGAGLTVPALGAGECARMFGASLADYDADGDVDLLSIAWTESDRSRLFDNDGAGRFTDVTAARGLDLSQVALLAPIFVDLDEDGDLDLVAVADFADTKVYLQEPGGGFVDVTATSTLARIHDGMGVDLGDVDGDGDADLYVSGICFPWPSGCLEASGWTGNHLFFAEGAGDVTDAPSVAGVRSAGWAWGAAFFDPDLDGDLDLVVTNGYDAFIEFADTPTRLFENDGAGRFTEVGAAWGIDDAEQGRAVVPFDMDGDGDEDLLVVNHFAPPVLYRNDAPKAGGSVSVRVALGPTNPEGLGAEVRLLRDDGVEQRRWISGHSRYLAHPPRAVRFGGLDSASTYRVQVVDRGAVVLDAPLSRQEGQVELRIE